MRLEAFDHYSAVSDESVNGLLDLALRLVHCLAGEEAGVLVDLIDNIVDISGIDVGLPFEY